MILREFTLRDKMGEGNFRIAQKEFGNPIPELVKLYLIKYGNSGIEEDIFVDKNNTVWMLQSFVSGIHIMTLPKEFKEAGWGEWLPFAFDLGGWHFCIHMADKDYGAVYVNRWSDYDENEQFIKIADSFEQFVNELKRESDL